MPLVSSRWLANSTRHKAWIEFHPTSSAISITVHTTGTPSGDPSVGTVRASSATCPGCGASATAGEVRAYGKKVGFGSQLYAVLDVEGRSRTYRVPTQKEIDGAFVRAATLLGRLPELEDGTSATPDEHCDPNGFRRVQNLVSESTRLRVSLTPDSCLFSAGSHRQFGTLTAKCFAVA